jgi:hypothetical protein
MASRVIQQNINAIAQIEGLSILNQLIPTPQANLVHSIILLLLFHGLVHDFLISVELLSSSIAWVTRVDKGSELVICETLPNVWDVFKDRKTVVLRLSFWTNAGMHQNFRGVQ